MPSRLPHQPRRRRYVCFRASTAMSFILDALKKSEREREQQSQGLPSEIVYSRRNATQPMWMFAVTGLLLLNFGFLLVLWLRGDRQQPAPVITVNSGPLAAAPAGNTPIGTTTGGATAVANSAPTNDSATATVRSLQDEASSSASEAPDETAALLAGADLPAGPQLVRSISPGYSTDAALNAAALANSNTASSNQNYFNRTNNTIPTLDSIGGSGALNLPQLHLDIHVYSAAAAERFVFINMRKYTEGQSLNEGPLVERITPEGAVLTYRNQRFVLPRQ
jgi:general secretion pathway protein B